VPYLWFVDPIAETLEATVLRDGRWDSVAFLSGDAVVCRPPFDAISFSLRRLWAKGAKRGKK